MGAAPQPDGNFQKGWGMFRDGACSENSWWQAVLLHFLGELGEISAQANSWWFSWDSNPSPSVSGALCGFPLPVSHPLAIVSWLAIKISSLLLFREKKTKYVILAQPQCLGTAGSTEDASYNSASLGLFWSLVFIRSPDMHGAWMWTPSDTGCSAALSH